MTMDQMQLDRRQMLAGLLAGGAFVATPAWAKKAKKAVASWPAVQAMLDDWVARKLVPGAVSGLARGLEPVTFNSVGKLGFGDSSAITPDSLFRAYSQTKPITGIAAMILVDEGKIKLDQNIADFIPGFANPRVMIDGTKSLESRAANRPITVRNLLTHTAGLGYTIVTKGPLLDAYLKLGLNPAAVSRSTLPGFPKIETAPSLEEFANRLATLPLIADPGERWSYSVGLDLLGRVIEVASGMPFDAFLSQRIFKPLGMTSSFFQVPAKDMGRLTDNHFLLAGTPIPIDPAKNSVYLDKPAFPFGGAGLVSSPRDFDRFLLMLMGEGAVGKVRILKPETARLAMSNIMPEGAIADGPIGAMMVKGQGFGAGGRVTLSKGPNGEGVGTFGWGGAASTIGWVDRTNNIRASGWIQLMTQGGQQFPMDLARAIYGTSKI
jgi:CubicO group peptidase (beta-lactamase class C family)